MSSFVLVSAYIGIFACIFIKQSIISCLRAHALNGKVDDMKSIIFTSGSPQPQQINKEWYGQHIVPPYEYSFNLSAQGLTFRAARKAAALVHPDGKCGAFQPELWRYDAAEFFITTADGKNYMEFNLSPNGAWWAALFCAPRQIAPGFENWEPQGIVAGGTSTAEGWSCEALIPTAVLKEAGIAPECCKLTAAAILQSPEQVFLTTALPCDTQPDFHRPDLWESAILAD